jgi:hypothetical protein
VPRSILSWPIKLSFISSVLCEVFSVTPIITDGQVEEDPLHDLHARQIWILWKFARGTPKTSCVCSSCSQLRVTSPSHCGRLSDYPKLLRHLWTDTALHDTMYRDVQWISWGHCEHLFWIYSFSNNPEIKCFRVSVDMGIFFLVLGTRGQSCPQLSVTPVIIL